MITLSKEFKTFLFIITGICFFVFGFNFLKGSLIDYQDDGLNKGIKFINPNAKAVCGCGESFTL